MFACEAYELGRGTADFPPEETESQWGESADTGQRGLIVVGATASAASPHKTMYTRQELAPTQISLARRFRIDGAHAGGSMGRSHARNLACLISRRNDSDIYSVVNTASDRLMAVHSR